MRVARPRTISEALSALDDNPGSQLLAGGTDFCVEVNYGHRRPEGVVCLRRVAELRDFEVGDGKIRIGAGTTYTEMVKRLSGVLPALAAAARTVGSPQIRNAGTLGGNVATASPAGDTLPLLAALDAEVVLVSSKARRVVPLNELITGVKTTTIGPGEMVAEVVVPRISGPQHFLKVGTRNAMVISIASAAVVVDLQAQVVRCGLGSVGPVPIRASRAEEMISEAIDWDDLSAPKAALERFGDLAAEAARPITDHRSTADYRKRAVAVIAARAMRRSLTRVT
ncbi:MAG: FAD binding domain-containing protein [Acidimicrobiales bacterium]